MTADPGTLLTTADPPSRGPSVLPRYAAYDGGPGYAAYDGGPTEPRSPSPPASRTGAVADRAWGRARFPVSGGLQTLVCHPNAPDNPAHASGWGAGSDLGLSGTGARIIATTPARERRRRRTKRPHLSGRGTRRLIHPASGRARRRSRRQQSSRARGRSGASLRRDTRLTLEPAPQ